MLALNALIVSRLRADTTFAAIAGVTATDPRVYRYYEGSAIINDTTKKAYITFARTARPERTQAVETPIYTLAAWAVDMDVAERVASRIRALFDFTRRPNETITLPTGEIVHPMVIADHMSAQENTKFAGIQIVVRFGMSTVDAIRLTVAASDALTVGSSAAATLLP